MTTIHKYPFRLTVLQTVYMPVEAQILTIQVQNGELFLWAEVDTDAPKDDYSFIFIGTGHEIQERIGSERKYITTIQLNSFVWHIFQLIF